MTSRADAPIDRLGRRFADLRISVTDRCNFRCPYCMPKEIFGPEYEFLPRSAILSFEEIVRLAAIFGRMGLRKLRLTGGEPTVRAQLPTLVAMLRDALPEIDLALTTNGSRLASLADELKAAGLDRVTVSLDSIDAEICREMNGVDFPYERVLEGIDAAARAGLGPIKINAVVKRGANDDGLVDMARHFRGTGHIVRFIEYMDVGTTNGWKLDEVVPAREIIERLEQVEELEPVEAAYSGEVARRWRWSDGSGEIGVITSVTEPFCGDCTRARLSAEGSLYTCLFASVGHDLRALLRSGASDEELYDRIAGIWTGREDRYSELRAAMTDDLPLLDRVEMSHIGG
ncbi:MAG: GTP 3',8-cyclase MoaA [Chloroflexota bacterium]|nr:GTP 3',8-cyclase MoaA [Chloroflexota bacterium]